MEGMGSGRRLYPVVALALLSGCGFDGRFESGYQCGVDDWCPPGQICVDGICTGDPSAPPDAEQALLDGSPVPPDAEPGAPRCGTLTLLQDDFEDTSIGILWDIFEETGASVSMNAGEAVVALAGGTADVWADFHSDAYYDFTDGVLDVEVLGVGGDFTVVEVNAYGQGLAQIYVATGVLTTAVLETADPGVRTQIPYQAAEHRYWRLRESEGTLYFEVSANRSAWTELHSEPMPFPKEHVRAFLAAGGQLAAGPSEARFGDVNLSAPDGLVHCPASELIDAFDTGATGPIWSSYSDAGCTVVEGSNVLTLTYDGLGTDYCGIDGNHRFDLRGSSVVIDAADAPDGTNFYAYFQVGLSEDDTTRLEIERDGDRLDIEQLVGGVESGPANIAYDAAAHRWWRIREQAGDVFFETAPDGATWTIRQTVEAGFDLSMIQVEIGAGHDDPGPGTTRNWVIPGVN
jgi:hypothetical protein